MPPPVMWARPLTCSRSRSGRDDRQVTTVRREQRRARRRAEFPHEGVGLQARDVEEHAPGERIAVGMQTGRRQANQDVARHDRPAVDDLRPVDRADDEAGEVVFAVGIETRHLGGLAADQRATVLAARARDPADDLFGDVRGQPPRRQVVEKEQRLGALNENVVDAVVDEIGADRVVAAGHEGDLELRPDAVGARDEHGILKPVAVEAEQTAERSDVGEHAGRERRPRQRLDPPHRLVSGVDVDAGLTVVHQKSSFPISVCINWRVGDPSGESQ